MREILFRGKSIKDGRWMYGFLGSYFNGQEYVMTISMPNMFKKNTGVLSTDVDRETIGQFTGEKDKKGKCIFGGDICLVANRFTDVVVFDSGCFCMVNQIYNYEFTWQNPEKMIVIGNIHDNPELLEREVE